MEAIFYQIRECPIIVALLGVISLVQVRDKAELLAGPHVSPMCYQASCASAEHSGGHQRCAPSGVALTHYYAAPCRPCLLGPNAWSFAGFRCNERLWTFPPLLT